MVTIGHANAGSANAPVATVADKSNTKALPQTGNNSSVALIALGAVASMLGLGLAKKREY